MNFSDWLDGFLSHDECDHTRRGMECPALDADDCGTTCDVFVIPRSADRPDCVAAVEAERRRWEAAIEAVEQQALMQAEMTAAYAAERNAAEAVMAMALDKLESGNTFGAEVVLRRAIEQETPE